MTTATERATAAQIEFVEVLAGELPDMALMPRTDAKAIIEALRTMTRSEASRLIDVLKAKRMQTKAVSHKEANS